MKAKAASFVFLISLISNFGMPGTGVTGDNPAPSPSPGMIDYSYLPVVPTRTVCIFADGNSPSVNVSTPENYEMYIVNDLEELLANCEGIADGHCSGGIYLDGHASDVSERYLTCTEEEVTTGHITTPTHDVNENYLLVGLRACLDRVSGNPALPLTVTACGGWASTAGKQACAAALGRPIATTGNGCAYCSTSAFACSDVPWLLFDPASPSPTPLPGTTTISGPAPKPVGTGGGEGAGEGAGSGSSGEDFSRPGDLDDAGRGAGIEEFGGRPDPTPTPVPAPTPAPVRGPSPSPVP